MFFFNRKKIVVDCFTFRQDVNDYSPIQPANEFIPDWWKKLPIPKFEGNELTLGNKKNMKGCVGFKRHYSRGFIMPLWSDVRINIGEKGSEKIAWQFSDQLSNAELHSTYQSEGFYDSKEYAHLKIVAPWFMKSNRFVDFHWSDPTWNMGNLIGRMTLLPGIVDTYYQPASNINLLFKREESEYTITVSQGTPLMHMIPLSEHKVDVRTHVISQSEFDRKWMSSIPIKFNNKYNVIRKIMMKNESSKCPFGFKK